MEILNIELVKLLEFLCFESTIYFANIGILMGVYGTLNAFLTFTFNNEKNDYYLGFSIPLLTFKNEFGNLSVFFLKYLIIAAIFSPVIYVLLKIIFIIVYYEIIKVNVVQVVVCSAIVIVISLVIQLINTNNRSIIKFIYDRKKRIIALIIFLLSPLIIPLIETINSNNITHIFDIIGVALWWGILLLTYGKLLSLIIKIGGHTIFKNDKSLHTLDMILDNHNEQVLNEVTIDILDKDSRNLYMNIFAMIKYYSKTNTTKSEVYKNKYNIFLLDMLSEYYSILNKSIEYKCVYGGKDRNGKELSFLQINFLKFKLRKYKKIEFNDLYARSIADSINYIIVNNELDHIEEYTILIRNYNEFYQEDIQYLYKKFYEGETIPYCLVDLHYKILIDRFEVEELLSSSLIRELFGYKLMDEYARTRHIKEILHKAIEQQCDIFALYIQLPSEDKDKYIEILIADVLLRTNTPIPEQCYKSNISRISSILTMQHKLNIFVTLLIYGIDNDTNEKINAHSQFVELLNLKHKDIIDLWKDNKNTKPINEKRFHFSSEVIMDAFVEYLECSKTKSNYYTLDNNDLNDRFSKYTDYISW